ncbi:IclR family transcriptional regulator [Thalassotalea insulae]|uniref:IclR family transcriptional regulator n=1 Tax=Thalassotalea insulae TaxID=2056778 RepID=A0ABQ6GQZ3_9GAMM|nr:uracil-DNA glycosylase family protein [Thalassotalea insulae]GLX77105.1 IclR family transcriptional regulator [Thalassotalea insulae]
MLLKKNYPIINTVPIESLLDKIRHCTLCASELPLAAKPILQASSQSKILIAGQAPGSITHEKGRPFDDKSGQRLRSWLGVSCAQFYDAKLFAIVPMGFCYPGKGQSGDLPPMPLCAKTWRAQVLAQLPDIQLTLMLGKYAINWHLQTNAKITDLAQDWQRLLAHNQLVLPHPSPRNNLWLKKNPWFEQQVLPALQQRVKQIIPDQVSR